MPIPFVSASQLSGDLYRDVVRPLLTGTPHSCALLGWGSDVLGYDTERSMDHGWGPRLLVFVDEAATVEGLAHLLGARLPDTWAGHRVRFGWDGVSRQSWVTVTTLGEWLREHLGVDASKDFTTLDWLVTPTQRLLGVVAGTVFSDDTGVLTPLRERLSFYPEQIWRWLLACQWRRIAQEEAFVARTAELGDGLGSAVIAARQVRELMRLALLLERRYAPYGKWLGTAFARLPCTDDLAGHLAQALAARNPQVRQDLLASAYVDVAERHNRTALTAPVAATIGPYHSRPAQVLMADRFTEMLLATVDDPDLRRLPLIGNVDMHTDSTDVLQSPRLFRLTASLYPGL